MYKTTFIPIIIHQICIIVTTPATKSGVGNLKKGGKKGGKHKKHDLFRIMPNTGASLRMQNFLTNYYNNVMEDAEAPTLDLNELRTELGSIKGVGEKRLDEIMAVIEKHLGIN